MSSQNLEVGAVFTGNYTPRYNTQQPATSAPRDKFSEQHYVQHLTLHKVKGAFSPLLNMIEPLQPYLQSDGRVFYGWQEEGKTGDFGTSYALTFAWKRTTMQSLRLSAIVNTDDFAHVSPSRLMRGHVGTASTVTNIFYQKGSTEAEEWSFKLHERTIYEAGAPASQVERAKDNLRLANERNPNHHKAIAQTASGSGEEATEDATGQNIPVQEPLTRQ